MDRSELFMDDYLFRGTHEEKARQLLSVFDSKSGASVFRSAVELFMTAALVGCVKNRKSIANKSSDQTLKIMAPQFKNHYDTLIFIYQLILLTAPNDNLEPIDRINRAFRTPENEDNLKLFDSYVLGGVDEIYEYFNIKSNTTFGDYLVRLYQLINDIKDEIRITTGTYVDILDI